jgi:protein O-mannosyl-transferase
MQTGGWTRPKTWPSWAGPLGVALFAFALYLPSIWGGYTLDDHQAILAHPAVTGDVGLLEVFLREFWGRPLGDGWSSSYRPLTSLSFAFEHRLTPAPWLHHLVNVAAYACLCALVVLLARRWCPPGVAIVSAVAFAALPIHVENVASIVGRADVLAAIASLLTILLALPVNGRPPALWAAPATGALYLVALLCKESAALLPALAVWLVWLETRAHGARRGLPRAFLPIGALVVVGVSYLLIRRQLLPVGLPEDFVPADNLLVMRQGLERVWGNLAIAGHYAELVFVPRRLCADHTYADLIPPLRALEVEAAWAWLGGALVLVVLRDTRRALLGRGPGLGVATALAYLLVGQWVIDLSVILAERLALWPTLWLLLAIGAATRAPLERMTVGGRRRVLLLSAILISLACVRTVDRTLDWRDTVSLQRASIASCPRSVHGRFILANALREQGEPQEAVWHYALAGAGRAAFPGRFDVPALDAEETRPLAERLEQLPALVNADDPKRYWASLYAYLATQGAFAEAEVVRRLAAGERTR